MPKSPPALLHNLLTDPLLGIEDNLGRRESATLPGLLARLSQGKPTTLTALQAHQQHPMHAFLVQLAAIALSRAGEGEIEHDEAAWRELLLNAAKHDGAGEEAFTLIVGDLKKPAFLQPPIPEGKLSALRNEHDRPSSELDVLITAKNHDVKIDRIDKPTVEHWIYGLLTLQTMQGFLGAGNYGIARMNGGFSSRPCVAYAPDYSEALRFQRDLRALLDSRDSLIEDFGFGQRGDLGLVWCKAWDGKGSLAFDELDPFFIEVCRRIRLTLDKDGKVLAHRGSSKAARIDSKAANGNTGDAWNLVARKDGKALTMPEAGFSYDRVQDFIFGNWHPGAAGETRSKDDRLFLGQVLVRGQGKTGGYHERWVPIPPKVRKRLGSQIEREKLGKRSEAWVSRAGTARLRILKPALLTLLQGGPEQLKFDDDRADVYLQRLDRAIDDEFFQLLFEYADADPEAADAAFEKRLVELAKSQLYDARQSLPVPTARRWRAQAKAENVFWGAVRNQFKLAYPPKAAASNEDAPQPTIGDSP